MLHRLLPSLLLVLLLAACASVDSDVPSDVGDDPAARELVPAPPGDDAPSEGDEEVDPGETLEVEIESDTLVLLGPGDERRPIADLDPARHGEVLHAAVRPGEHATTTVLLLTRVQQRYELRYLMTDGEETSDLYGLPWRLQVDEHLARTLDVAPTPVWAPDGSAVAWLEWDDEGTRLRTVGWRDHGAQSNPSDDAQAYRVEGVPRGTQLQRWVQEASRPVLHGSDGSTEWRIELDLDRRAVAMPA